jgi:hypothetical protein
MRIVWHLCGLWLALCACVVIRGVAAHGQRPDADAKAIVYVFRERLSTGMALKPSIFCDDVELARIQNGRYFRVRLESGHHVFRSTGKEAPLDLNARTGGVYYIQAEIIPGGLKGHARLTLLPPGGQPYTIRELRALDADLVKDRGRVSAAGEIPDSPSLQDLEPRGASASTPAAVAAPAAAPATPQVAASRRRLRVA